MMESTYSVSSFDGLVSSKRRLHLPPNSRGQAEIEIDGFRVADVQIAVRLRRKTRMHAAAVFVGLQVFDDDVPDEIGRGRRSFPPVEPRSLVDAWSLSLLELLQQPDRSSDAFEAGFAAQHFQRLKQRRRVLCGRTRRRGWAGTSGRP